MIGKRTKIMRKLLCILIALAAVLSLAACADKDKGDKNGGGTTELPEGAIELTADNITEYFDIRVTTECTPEYTEGAEYTLATSSVAVVPRGVYSEVVGEIEFQLNATIKRSALGMIRVASGNRSLLLDEGVVNDYYQAHAEGEYFPDTSTNNVTVVSVYGYLLPGEAKPSELDRLTDADRQSSPTVRQELAGRLDGLFGELDTATSYKLLTVSAWQFNSIYGDRESIGKAVSTYGALDRIGGYYSYGDGSYPTGGIYLELNGELYVQQKNDFGLVMQERSQYTREELESLLTPDYDKILDTGAVFVKDGDDCYIAYTTLSAMSDCPLRASLIERLENYGITKQLDDFTVSISYSFDTGVGSFDYGVSIVRNDPTEPVGYYEFYDQTVTYSVKVADINNTSVTPYTSENASFLLSTTIEDAMLFNLGLVELNGNVETVAFTVYSEYGGDENYLPIAVTEGGVYTLSLTNGSTVRLYDSEGNYFGDGSSAYLGEGTYYLRLVNLPRGKDDLILRSSSLILEDYGDLSAPTPLESNLIPVYLETANDMQAFAFTPHASGLYDLSFVSGASISVHRADALDDYSTLYAPYCAVYLDGGVDYVLEFISYTAEPISQTCVAAYVGDPAKNTPAISADWSNQILLFYGYDRFYIDIDKVGYYRFEHTLNEWDGSEYFVTEDGKYLPVETVDDGNGGELYVLTPGRYYIRLSVNMGEFRYGSIRLDLVTEGVAEEREVTLSYDSYTELKSSELTTMGSYSVFRFTLTESATVLITTDSDGRLCSADGTPQWIVAYPTYTDTDFGSVECYRYLTLAPGEYYFIFENTSNETKQFTAHVRLLKE